MKEVQIHFILHVFVDEDFTGEIMGAVIFF